MTHLNYHVYDVMCWVKRSELSCGQTVLQYCCCLIAISTAWKILSATKMGGINEAVKNSDLYYLPTLFSKGSHPMDKFDCWSWNIYIYIIIYSVTKSVRELTQRWMWLCGAKILYIYIYIYIKRSVYCQYG